jgi:hypothetical protein
LRFRDVLVADIEVGSRKIYPGILTSLSAVLSLLRCSVIVSSGESAMIQHIVDGSLDLRVLMKVLSTYGCPSRNSELHGTSTPRSAIFLCVFRSIRYAIVARMAQIDLLFLPRFYDCQ